MSLQKLISKMLVTPEIRRRLAFSLRQDYWEDMDMLVPIGDGLVCPIARRDYLNCFEGVFFGDEYWPAFQRIELPKRWLDLGCHAGFSSLLMYSMRRKKKLTEDVQALLVDGDARVKLQIDRIIQRNKLEGKFQFRHGAISAQPGEVVFEEAPIMSSSVKALGSGVGNLRSVPVMTADDLVAALPGPYDLVKIDVEGSEYDFLTHYEKVLRQTRYILMEWHSWHNGGGGLETIHKAIRDAGFKVLLEPVHSHPTDGDPTRFCGVLLLESERSVASAS